MEMEGKVVIVTGASMGIGEAIAKLFADEGARVVLLSRDASRAEAARHRVGHTERTLAMACDVRNREDIDRALALTLHHFDRVDVWVNNAGVGIRDSVADMAMSACRDLFETNFFGTIACIQAVVPAMREAGGGDIINISSVAGHIPVPFMAIYSASKFAVNAIGKGARLELKRDNINVLTVCPGYVRTDFGEHVVADRQFNVRPQSVQGITAERVARAAYRGYRKGKREVVVPWTMIPAIKLYQLFPGLVEWVMARAMRNAR
jgi:short-subunit dehydrogenase